MRFALSVAVLVASCTPFEETLPKVRGPDGRNWWILECRSKKECWTELGRQCPGGYDIADQSTEYGAAVAVSVGRTTVSRQSSEDELLFRCKNDP